MGVEIYYRYRQQRAPITGYKEDHWEGNDFSVEIVKPNE